MPPQQQRKQAHKKTTFLAGLLGSIDKDRKSSNSPSSSVSPPTTAQMPSRATPSSSRSSEISTGAAPINNDSPYAPLPRAASTPFEVARSDPCPSTPSTSLVYGPYPGERPSPQPGSGSTSTRPHYPVSDSYGTDSGSRSPHDSHHRRDVDRGRGVGSYRPGSVDKTTPPSRDRNVRHVASSPVTQMGTAATKSPAATGTSGVQAQQIATPTPQPGAIRPFENIIADLLKPQPVLVAQAQARAEAEKTPEPQRRKADVYRPRQVTRRQANRLDDRQEYQSWSDDQLLREANLRRLRSESKYHQYLVDILMFNDNKFSETRYGFEALGVQELLEEAEINRFDVDFAKHWSQRELLTLIADKMSQHAVNDLPRAEAAAQKFAQAQTARALKVPCVDNGRSKVTKRGQKVKDRVTPKKAVEDLAEELFEADAAKKGLVAGMKKEVSQQKDEAVSKKRFLSVNKDENPQEERSELPRAKRSRKATDAGEDLYPVDVDEDVEDGEIDERLVSKELDDEDAESSEVIPLEEIAQIKRRKSSSESSQEAEDEMCRHNDRVIKKTKLKGIPPEECVKGVAYTRLADGSYKAAQRIQKVGKVAKTKSEPAELSKNYIKR